jgi:hypothetical protein
VLVPPAGGVGGGVMGLLGGHRPAAHGAGVPGGVGGVDVQGVGDVGAGVDVVVELQPFRVHPQSPVEQVLHPVELVAADEALHPLVALVGNAAGGGRRLPHQLRLGRGQQPPTLILDVQVGGCALRATCGPLGGGGADLGALGDGVVVEGRLVHDLEQMPGALRDPEVAVALRDLLGELADPQGLRGLGDVAAGGGVH